MKPDSHQLSIPTLPLRLTYIKMPDEEHLGGSVG